MSAKYYGEDEDNVCNDEEVDGAEELTGAPSEVDPTAHLNETVIPAMKAIHPECGIETEVIADVAGLQLHLQRSFHRGVRTGG